MLAVRDILLSVWWCLGMICDLDIETKYCEKYSSAGTHQRGVDEFCAYRHQSLPSRYDPNTERKESLILSYGMLPECSYYVVFGQLQLCHMSGVCVE